MLEGTREGRIAHIEGASLLSVKRSRKPIARACARGRNAPTTCGSGRRGAYRAPIAQGEREYTRSGNQSRKGRGNIRRHSRSIHRIAKRRGLTNRTGREARCRGRRPQPERNITSFYGSSCANNGKDALNTPGRPQPESIYLWRRLLPPLDARAGGGPPIAITHLERQRVALRLCANQLGFQRGQLGGAPLLQGAQLRRVGGGFRARGGGFRVRGVGFRAEEGSLVG
eukprot:1179563-Prorocentrum_minimum.AAC.2